MIWQIHILGLKMVKKFKKLAHYLIRKLTRKRIIYKANIKIKSHGISLIKFIIHVQFSILSPTELHSSY